MGDSPGSKIYFDLASLTKPLVTSLSLLRLIEMGQLDWEDRLGTLIDRAVPRVLQEIRLASLINHSSGLAPHRDFWKDAVLVNDEERCGWLLDTLLVEQPLYREGTDIRYSDLGYMLLGLVIEQKAGKNLAEFWKDVVATPLDIEKELFFPLKKGVPSGGHVAPTGTCPWSGEELRGLVHDDNCRAMGGAGGHAGLFGTASAVLTLCLEILKLCRGEKSRLPVSTPTFQRALLKISNKEWSAGFNHPSAQGSSSGRYFSKKSLGHLGFTGTSFWIDPESGIVVVLLTNRVLMGDDLSGIQELRPLLHDRVVQGVLKKEPPGA
jgi:CubicO group peptidase (beta-lactamase class C family)